MQAKEGQALAAEVRASSKTKRTRVAFKIPEWGDGYGFRKSKSYAIIKSGEGPETVEVAGVTMITIEADEEWRRSRPPRPVDTAAVDKAVASRQQRRRRARLELEARNAERRQVAGR